MPPKRSGASDAEGHGRSKKHRIKVLDHVPSNLSVSPSTRTFAVRRLPNGRKGQKRTQSSSHPHEQTAADLVAGGTAGSLDVDVGPLSMDTNDPEATPRISDARDSDLDEAALVNSDIEDIPGHDAIHRTKRRKTQRKVPVDSDIEDGKGRPSQRGNQTARRTTTWLSHRDTFLDELLRHEGNPNHTALCPLCNTSPASIRCQDCCKGIVFCQPCLVDCHRQLQLPLHRVEIWTGTFFDKTTLRDLGLTVHLGHGGAPCPNQIQGYKNFLVFDVSGAHRVAVNFCGCIEASDFYVQILRVGWYPATSSRPQTAFTFEYLSLFHELTLQGKINIYDVYHTVLRITDGAGITPTPYRYAEMTRAVREWRHLMMLKRAGRGHDSAGASGTTQGELAVECPACPHPGRNLPHDWINAPESDRRYLYALFISQDSNFRLTSKERKLQDIELGPGWAYFVDNDPYLQFICSFPDQKENNTCSADHDAIRRANTRNKAGWRASGVAGTTCARHTLIRRNGMGDLQKGEKYCNVDYVLLSTLSSVVICLIFITYDIVCQWHKNFPTRNKNFPIDMQLNNEKATIRYGIPKFHLNAHGPECQTLFSLNYMTGAARTCGEGIETGWAHTNPLSTSTREMSPGARRETLNDHWGAWNWRKIVGFGSFFFTKFREAVVMREKHRRLYTKYTTSFSPDVIQAWEESIQAWIQDQTKPDPYREPICRTTMADVRLELANEDARVALTGLSAHEVSPSTFVDAGLEIEDQQRALRSHVRSLAAKPTSYQLTTLQQKRHALRHRVESWREIQRIYMPFALQSSEGSNRPDDEDSKIEDVSLHLPSSLPASTPTTQYSKSLLDIELRLRVAQADDALDEIRRYRRITTRMYQFKQANLSGEGNKMNTRAREIMRRYAEKATSAAERYHAAFVILSALDPGGEWATRLQELRDADIRGPGKDDDEPSEGRREPSWIWLVPRGQTDIGDEECDAHVRVEWAKLKARLARWEEEVLLLNEEMRRTLAFMTWKASWWRNRAVCRSDASPELRSGLIAYAEKQATILERLARKFTLRWLPILKANGFHPVWEAQFSSFMHAEATTAQSEEEEEEDGDEPTHDQEDNEPLTSLDYDD